MFVLRNAVAEQLSKPVAVGVAAFRYNLPVYDQYGQNLAAIGFESRQHGLLFFEFLRFLTKIVPDHFYTLRLKPLYVVCKICE